MENDNKSGFKGFARIGGRGEVRNSSRGDQRENKYLYKSSKDSGSAFFDDVDEAILKGNLSDNDENELTGKSEIVEKFIKVVENNETPYLSGGQQQNETGGKSSRNNPFGKGDKQTPNSREDIRKKLAFGGFGNDLASSGDNTSRKPGYFSTNNSFKMPFLKYLR